jgi:hypothetical protein
MPLQLPLFRIPYPSSFPLHLPLFIVFACVTFESVTLTI